MHRARPREIARLQKHRVRLVQLEERSGTCAAALAYGSQLILSAAPIAPIAPVPAAHPLTLPRHKPLLRILHGAIRIHHVGILS